MKARSIILTALAGMLALSSCTDRQMQGTMMGSTLGAIFGSSIGGVMNGPRGSDAGTAIGMAVGAVIGNAVTSPKATGQPGRDEGTYDDSYGSSSNDGYGDGQRPRRRSRRSHAPEQSAEPARPSSIEGLKITNIRFVDENRNQTIDAGEKAKIMFEIHNSGDRTLYNITPVVTCSDEKRISVSPTAIIANLEAGKAVTYTANLLATQKLKDGEVAFNIAFQDGARRVSYKDFTLKTHSAK